MISVILPKKRKGCCTDVLPLSLPCVAPLPDQFTKWHFAKFDREMHLWVRHQFCHSIETTENLDIHRQQCNCSKKCSKYNKKGKKAKELNLVPIHDDNWEWLVLEEEFEVLRRPEVPYTIKPDLHYICPLCLCLMHVTHHLLDGLTH